MDNQVPAPFYFVLESSHRNLNTFSHKSKSVLFLWEYSVSNWLSSSFKRNTNLSTTRFARGWLRLGVSQLGTVDGFRTHSPFRSLSLSLSLSPSLSLWLSWRKQWNENPKLFPSLRFSSDICHVQISLPNSWSNENSREMAVKKKNYRAKKQIRYTFILAISVLIYREKWIWIFPAIDSI